MAELAHRAHDTLDVLALVVRRQNHENLGGRRVARRDAHLLGAYLRNRTLTRSLNMSTEWRMAATLVGAECRQTTGTSAIRAPRFFSLALSFQPRQTDLCILSIRTYCLQFITQPRNFGARVAQFFAGIECVALSEVARVPLIVQFGFQPRDFLVRTGY